MPENAVWPTDDNGKPVERRSIPIHLLTYVDEKLEHHAKEIKGIVVGHTSEEMDRYEEIITIIKAHREEMDARYNTLLRSIDSYTDKVERVHEHLSEAFLTDKKGRPDFQGHAHAHEAWVEEAKQAKELRAYIQKVVLATAAVAIGSWLLAVVWPAVLQGPK